MKTRQTVAVLAGLLVGAMAFAFAGVAFATPLPGSIIDGSPPLTLTFDEQGNGTLTTASGSLPAYWPTNNSYGIQYRLFALVQPGDVLVTDPADISPTNPNGWSDILHFWNDDNLGGLMLYQSLWDENDTVHDLADIPFPNFGYYGVPPFTISENGPEGNNGFQWIAGSAIYNGISDIPEPSTFILGGLGLVALILIGRRRRRS